jgi:aerobic-type carbon monoxide dehydrogenase small subunit (CoxS/CutS family)
MIEQIQLKIDGEPVVVPRGCTVAAAIALTGRLRFRRSIRGEARGPLCGMGVCLECRVTLNGQKHCRSCQILCEQGMEVRTDE